MDKGSLGSPAKPCGKKKNFFQNRDNLSEKSFLIITSNRLYKPFVVLNIFNTFVGLNLSLFKKLHDKTKLKLLIKFKFE